MIHLKERAGATLTVTNDSREPVGPFTIGIETGPRLGVGSIGTAWSSVNLDRSYSSVISSTELEPGAVLEIPVGFESIAGFYSYEVAATISLSEQGIDSATIEVRR